MGIASVEGDDGGDDDTMESVGSLEHVPIESLLHSCAEGEDGIEDWQLSVESDLLDERGLAVAN